MGFLAPPAPKIAPTPPPVDRDDTAVQAEAARRQAEELRRRRSRTSSILSGDAGTDGSDNIKRKTLLGD